MLADNLDIPVTGLQPVTHVIQSHTGMSGNTVYIESDAVVGIF